MRVLVDINHPAHVHLFKNVIWELKAHGHTVGVTSRKKEITMELLNEYGINHTRLSSVGESAVGLVIELIKKDIALYRYAKKFQPDIFIGCNPAIAHISMILDGKSIILTDTESKKKEQLFVPFADCILTPDGFNRDFGNKQYRYSGYHELAYLHPDRFSPDLQELRERGIKPNETFSVVRFVSWGAHHDIGQDGLSREAKRKIISRLDDVGTVYITAEAELPAEFASYRLPIPPHLIHSLLAAADYYIGESGTMAIEAGVLGTPSIRSNSFAGDGDRGVFTELEAEYGLVYSTPREEEALRKLNELTHSKKSRQEWQNKRKQLIGDKIDVTTHIVNKIEEIQATTQ